MKTKTTVITAFSAVILAIGVTTVVLINQPAKTEVETKTSAQPTAEQTQQETVTFTAEKDKDVLTQLKEHATVVTKDSEFGPYVDALNGMAGGTDGKYWSFYVDGELAQKGAADYKTVGGEKIEWKFE